MTTNTVNKNRYTNQVLHKLAIHSRWQVALKGSYQDLKNQ